MAASRHMWLLATEMCVVQQRKFVIFISSTINSHMWLVAFILNSTVLRSYQMTQTQTPINFSQHSLSKSSFQHSTLRFLLAFESSSLSIVLTSSHFSWLNFLLSSPKDSSVTLKLVLILLHFKLKTVSLINLTYCHNSNHHLYVEDFQI